MATLEVHDGRGRVDRLEVGSDEPILFGSGPSCDLSIPGAGVANLHGRIAWRKGRLEVGVAAEVEGIEVNGSLVKRKRLKQGDEIRVGSYRIFVLDLDLGRRDRRVPAGEKTRIQPAPLASAGGSTISRTSPGAVFESPSFDEILSPPSELSRSKRKRREAIESLAESTAEIPPIGSGRKPSRAAARRAKRGDAPGEERVFSSPMVIGLVVALLMLGLGSLGLYRVIVKANAETAYEKAFASLNDGDYRNAARRLDEFLGEYPDDPRANKARVYRSLASVRQFTSTSGTSWENAYQLARAMVDDVGSLREYADASIELAEQVVKVVEGLADKSRANADPESLALAEAALGLEREIAGPAADGLLGRSRALPKLDQAREAIRRARAKAAALVTIDRALAEGSAARAYAGRDALIVAFPDLAGDRDIIPRLTSANELIRKSVTFDSKTRPGETSPRPDPLGPTVALVLRSEPMARPGPGNPVAYATADGVLFGFDATNGAPLWSRAVGSGSPYPAVPLEGGNPAAILVDTRHDDLLRIDGRDGGLVWRQPMGGPITDPPLVLGNTLYQATPAGDLVAIDIAGGEVLGTLHLGRRLRGSAVADESGEHLFVLADEACLFVVDRDPLSCRAVVYLGQQAGTIPCTPARVGQFLVVPENTTLEGGRWRIFVLGDSDGSVTLRQTLPVAGWTWATPQTSGSVIWSASDRGAVVAYALGLPDASEPLRPIATIAGDVAAGGPAYGLARTEREFWLGWDRPVRYDLDSQANRIVSSWGLGPIGPAAAPPRLVGKLAIFLQATLDGAGVDLRGVDPRDGAIRWRTQIGLQWPAPLLPAPGSGNDSLATLGFDGRALRISRDLLDKGGFVEATFLRAGSFRAPSVGAKWIACGDATVMISEPDGASILVRRGDEPYRRVDLPAPLGATPIAWGKELLVPGVDGRAYLLDPTNGELAAEPFVPPFDRSRTSRWRSPTPIGGDAMALADDTGRVRRLVRTSDPRPKLVAAAEVDLGKPLVADPASTADAVLFATGDDKIRVLAARDLSSASTIDLTSPPAFGPVSVGGHAFVGDARGQVVAFGEGGRRIWSTTLQAGSAPISAPVVREGLAWFLVGSGAFEARRLADGSFAEGINLGILPSGRPIASGQGFVIPTGLGMVRTLRAPVDSGSTPNPERGR